MFEQNDVQKKTAILEFLFETWRWDLQKHLSAPFIIVGVAEKKYLRWTLIHTAAM